MLSRKLAVLQQLIIIIGKIAKDHKYYLLFSECGCFRYFYPRIMQDVIDNIKTSNLRHNQYQ